ncbi:HNH endonuclease signature motif containing protein, partial [Cryobacterium sp. RTC2.1]
GAPSFTRLLTHPETGVVLSMGRDTYKPPAALKKWLEVRDETCTFPGCRRSAKRSDLDHSVEWQHGGETDAMNLAHLCPYHHA